MNKKSTPYGTYGLEKINSPKNQKKGQPSSVKTSGNTDLRGGKKS